jgi:hypothetical protein
MASPPRQRTAPSEEARRISARLIALHAGDGEPDPDLVAIGEAPAFLDAVDVLLQRDPHFCKVRAFGLLMLLINVRRRARLGQPLDAGMVKLAAAESERDEAIRCLREAGARLTKLSAGASLASMPAGWRPPQVDLTDWRGLFDLASEGSLGATMEAIARTLEEVPPSLLVPDGKHGRSAHLPEEDSFGARGRASADPVGRDTGALVRELAARLDLPEDYLEPFSLVADLSRLAGFPVTRQVVRRTVSELDRKRPSPGRRH